MSASKSRPKRWQRLLAEALVVFVGVYSAFMLDGYRERRAGERRQAQILSTLRQDFAEGEEALVAIEEWFEKTLGGPFLDSYEAGGEPALLPIPLLAAEGTNSWESMLAAGGLDVLDVALIRAVDKLVATSNQMSSLAQSYNDYLRTVLVPNLDREAAEFYIPETGKLRPKYLWYYYSLLSVRQTLEAFEVLLAECEALAAD